MKHQIVNLRGGNGSGKTTIVRRFLERLPHEKLGENSKKPWGYKVDASAWGLAVPVMIVGSYENACGGGDGISSQEEITNRTLIFQKQGHVLVESLLMSKSSAGGYAAPRLKEAGAIFAFLDTPFEIGLERVLARRLAAGNDKPFDPEKTMRSAYEQCHRSYELLTEAGGYDVRWLDWQDPVTGVMHYLLDAES